MRALILAVIAVAAVACADSTAPVVRSTQERMANQEGTTCRHGYVVTGGRDGEPAESTYTGCTSDDQ